MPKHTGRVSSSIPQHPPRPLLLCSRHQPRWTTSIPQDLNRSHPHTTIRPQKRRSNTARQPHPTLHLAALRGGKNAFHKAFKNKNKALLMRPPYRYHQTQRTQWNLPRLDQTDLQRTGRVRDSFRIHRAGVQLETNRATVIIIHFIALRKRRTETHRNDLIFTASYLLILLIIFE